MNTGNYVDSTIHSASQTLDSSKAIIFGGHHLLSSICLEVRNRRVDLNRANDGQRYIPETPCQISSAARGHNIWHQDPNHTPLNYGCWNVADTLILTQSSHNSKHNSNIGGILRRLPPGRDECNVFPGLICYISRQVGFLFSFTSTIRLTVWLILYYVIIT